MSKGKRKQKGKHTHKNKYETLSRVAENIRDVERLEKQIGERGLQKKVEETSRQTQQNQERAYDGDVVKYSKGTDYS